MPCLPNVANIPLHKHPIARRPLTHVALLVASKQTRELHWKIQGSKFSLAYKFRVTAVWVLKLYILSVGCVEETSGLESITSMWTKDYCQCVGFQVLYKYFRSVTKNLYLEPKMADIPLVCNGNSRLGAQTIYLVCRLCLRSRKLRELYWCMNQTRLSVCWFLRFRTNI